MLSTGAVMKAVLIGALAPPALLSILYLIASGNAAGIGPYVLLAFLLLLPVSFAGALVAGLLFLFFIKAREFTIWHVVLTSAMVGAVTGAGAVALFGTMLPEGFGGWGLLLGMGGGLVFATAFWRLLPRASRPSIKSMP